MINSVTLLGSSSGRNAGDAALIAGIMDSIDQRLGRKIRYEIPTLCPAYIRDQYDNDTRPVGMMPWHASVKMLGVPTLRSVMRSDLTLLFDAILFDRSLFNPLFNFMSSLYLMLPVAKMRGKKMGFMNVGAGPVETQAGQHMLRKLSEMMDFITVRDATSYDILQDLGVQNPCMRIAADSAVTVRPADAARVDAIYEGAGIDPDEEFLAVNVNRYLDTWAGTGRAPLSTEAFVDIYVRALNQVVEQLNIPVVLVATQHHDVEVSQKIIDGLAPGIEKALISNVDHNHYDIKGVLGRADLLFGMRLHACILGSSALTPIVGLRYQPKVEHYMSSIGLQDYCMTFDDFSAPAVVKHILHGWENRAAIRAILEEQIPRLQQKADASADLVAAIDAGEDLNTLFAE